MSIDEKNIDALNFEDALAELERVVRSLEEGKSPLEEAIHSYERGILLKKHCEKKLNEATLKVEKILMTPEGTFSIEQKELSEI
ncbi:MAG: exodeoxyribonuclease VII small subunit [Proteobacteria bacterium]|nr:exodeoxyribonuclease VII small subunit [Pseudomonadota bacterium]